MFSTPMGRIEARSMLELLLIPSIAISICFGLISNCQSQDANGVDEPLRVVDNSIIALEKIQKDYVEFLAKRKRIQDEYMRVEDTLKKTVEDFQRINNDAIRQQLLMMQSSFQSMLIDSTIRDRSDAIGQEGRILGLGAVLIDQQSQILAFRKAMADLDTASRRLELNQLDAASQTIVRRRIECFEHGYALQQEWAQWQQDWPSFMARYWPHSDPERRFTRAEIEARIAVLQNSDPEDVAASITSALLMERLGMFDKALATIDRVIASETAIRPTALCAKGLILHSLERDKDAKVALKTAAKAQTKSPYERWIRARIAASLKHFPGAESEWKALVAFKPFEIEARRSLALVYLARLEKSTTESKKALKEAQLAFDLESTHDWYSHLVLGMALSAAKKGPEALKQLKEAEDKATDENLELCTDVREAIQEGRPFEWDFHRKFGDSDH